MNVKNELMLKSLAAALAAAWPSMSPSASPPPPPPGYRQFKCLKCPRKCLKFPEYSGIA